MRTCCMIANALQTGGFQAIYCHTEGHDHDLGVGPTLRHCYTKPHRVLKLISLGDVASISEHNVTAYHRDIGQPWGMNQPKLVDSPGDLQRLARRYGAEYVYVFKDEKWKTAKINIDSFVAPDI